MCHKVDSTLTSKALSYENALSQMVHKFTEPKFQMSLPLKLDPTVKPINLNLKFRKAFYFTLAQKPKKSLKC